MARSGQLFFISFVAMEAAVPFTIQVAKDGYGSPSPQSFVVSRDGLPHNTPSTPLSELQCFVPERNRLV